MIFVVHRLILTGVFKYCLIDLVEKCMAAALHFFHCKSYGNNDKMYEILSERGEFILKRLEIFHLGAGHC